VIVDVPIAATPAASFTTSTPVSTPSSGPAASMEDVPIKIIDIFLIGAEKLKKRVASFFSKPL
jgi:hypothetical protein